MANLHSLVSRFTFLEFRDYVNVRYVTPSGLCFCAECYDMYLLARTFYRKQPLRGDKKFWVDLARYVRKRAKYSYKLSNWQNL